jgi:outer membrane protein
MNVITRCCPFESLHHSAEIDMEKLKRKVVVPLLLMLISTGSFSQKSITIGVVVDGTNQRCSGDPESFKNEVTSILGTGYTVGFTKRGAKNPDVTILSARQQIDSLLNDDGIDMVITMGPVSSHAAIQHEEYSKPVIAPFILDSKLQGAPFSSGTSGVHNFCYLDVPLTIRRDLQFFMEMTGCHAVAFLINRALVEAADSFSSHLIEIGREIGCSLLLVPVGESVDSSLQSIPDSIDGVYLSSLNHIKPDGFKQLLDGLNGRHLPTFSLHGESDVKMGVLLSLNPDPCKRIYRKLGIMMQRILMGDDPSTFQVYYSAGERLTFNIETARRIGFEPAWYIFNEADIVGDLQRKKGPGLTLNKAVETVVQKSPDLKAAAHKVRGAEKEVFAAASLLMPAVSFGSDLVAVEEEVAAAARGTQPQYTGEFSATVSQVLFSDAANMNVAVKKHAHTAQKMTGEQQYLDCTLEAAVSYFNVLKTLSFERIKRENMKRCRRYLEIARIRSSVGTAEPGEVYLWESRIATALHELIEANSLRNQTEIQLNRLLVQDLENTIHLSEQNETHEKLLSRWQHYNRYFVSKTTFQAYREFMVKEALESSPEIKAIDAMIALKERMMKNARRSFWIPTLAVQGQVTNRFLKKGEGADVPIIPGAPDEVNWVAGANLTLPIYRGTDLIAKYQVAHEAVEELKKEREAAVQKIEQRVRSTLHDAGASFAGIRQARKASSAAYKALETVYDGYSVGAASMVHLIDAQNSAQIAEEAVNNSVFDYLQKLMQVQRSIGSFDFFKTDEEISRFNKRCDLFIAGITGADKAEVNQ